MKVSRSPYISGAAWPSSAAQIELSGFFSAPGQRRRRDTRLATVVLRMSAIMGSGKKGGGRKPTVATGFEKPTRVATGGPGWVSHGVNVAGGFIRRGGMNLGVRRHVIRFARQRFVRLSNLFGTISE